MVEIFEIPREFYRHCIPNGNSQWPWIQQLNNIRIIIAFVLVNRSLCYSVTVYMTLMPVLNKALLSSRIKSCGSMLFAFDCPS